MPRHASQHSLSNRTASACERTRSVRVQTISLFIIRSLIKIHNDVQGFFVPRGFSYSNIRIGHTSNFIVRDLLFIIVRQLTIEECIADLARLSSCTSVLLGSSRKGLAWSFLLIVRKTGEGGQKNHRRRQLLVIRLARMLHLHPLLFEMNGCFKLKGEQQRMVLRGFSSWEIFTLGPLCIKRMIHIRQEVMSSGQSHLFC